MRPAPPRAAWLEAGHRQIGIIVGPTDIFTSQLRLKGYREALEEYGVAPCENLIAYSDYTVQGGYRRSAACWRKTNR